MSNVFKKLLSVILAFSVVLSVMSVGFTASAFEGEPDDALTLGTPITVNGSGVYSFTAETAGGYIFYSENGRNTDPYAELYDADGISLGSNDDDRNSETGRDFLISCYLNAGETCYLEIDSYSGGEFTVGVKPTNVESISVVNHGFTGYVEKNSLGSGYWCEECDQNGNVLDYYFMYNTDSSEMLEDLIIEVTYNDGTPKEQIGYWEGTEDESWSTGVNVSDNQSYENQWSPDGTNNKITVSYMGVSTTVDVEIAPTNVKSISIDPSCELSFTEHDQRYGHWQNHYEQGEYVGKFFFYYPEVPTLKINVEYKDDTPDATITYFSGDYEWSGISVSFDQSYQKPFTVGDNNVATIRYMGAETTANVTILSNAVQSISVKNCSFKYTEYDENCGWWRDAYDENDNYLGEYFYYEPEMVAESVELEVTYNDDREPETETIGYYIGEGEDAVWSGINYDHEQSYQNPWTVGGNNTITFSYMGKTCEYSAVIEKGEIDHIEVNECTFKYPYGDTNYGEWNGNDNDKYFYYEPWYAVQNTTLKVVYTDETRKPDIIRVSEDEGETGFSYDHSQHYYNQWTPGGENKITFMYKGHRVNYSAVIEESPIESITLFSGDFTFIEGDDSYGYWVDDNPKWFYYESWGKVHDAVFKVEYKDENTSDAYINYYDSETDEYSGFGYWDEQEIKHFTLGSDNTLNFYYMGIIVPVTVTITESPVASIEVVSCDFEYTEYDETYGWTEYENWEEETGEFFYYDTDPIRENATVKVTFKDETQKPIVIGYYDDEGERTGLDCYSNQFENHWQAGSDNNIVTFSYLGATVEHAVTVNASPIESIELVAPESITFNEYDDSDEGWRGYWTTADGIEYFYYNVDSIRYNLEIRVNYTAESGKGSKIIGYYDDEGERTGLNLIHNQTPYNPWTSDGNNNITLSYLGKSIDVPVVITPTDVESIEYVSGGFTYTEGNISQGWWEDEYNEWDDYLGNYFYYDPDYIARNATILVTYTAESGKESEEIGYWDPAYEDRSTGITVSTNQSYENQWSADNDNMQATLMYRGKTCPAPVSIQKDPIQSIEVISGGNYQFFKNDTNCGSWQEGYDEWDDYVGDYFHYEAYLAMQDVVIRVYYTDDTYEDISYQDSDEIEFGSTQNWQNQWNDENSDRSIEVIYRGHKTSFTANIIDTPIQSIEIADNSYVYDAYKNGSWNSYYDEETGKDVYYYWYSVPEMLRGLTLTVNYKEGYDETETLTDLYELYNNWEAWQSSGITLDYNQSYNYNWLPGGENTVTITYKGASVDIPVTINPSTVTGIELVSNDFYYIENDYHTGLDSEEWVGEDLVEYFRYDENQVLYNGAKFRVYYQDGSEEVIDNWSADEYELFAYSNQSYYNQWQVGTENNTVTINYGGAEYSFDVEVKKTEVASITVNDGGYKFIEGLALENWYAYNLSGFIGNLNLHVTYENGEEEDIGCDYSIDWYDESGTAIFTNQTEENPWVVGGNNNIIYICYKGFTVEHPATLIANPVESIRVIDDGFTLTKNDNGYYANDDLGNEFFYYRTDELEKHLVLEITYVGGETEEKTFEELSEGGYFETTNDQYFNHWDTNKENPLEIKYYNRTTTYYVTVEESPVTNIDVIGADTFWLVAEDYDYGWWNGDYFYYSEDTIAKNIRLNVTYMDGDEEKTEIVDYYNNTYDGKTNFEITSNQSYENPWEVDGENNTVTITYMGYSTSFNVEVKTLTEAMRKPIGIEYVRTYEGCEYVNEDLGVGYWLKDTDDTPEYFHYDSWNYLHNSIFRITFEAGNTECVTYGQYGWDSYFSYEDIQSHETPWTIGGDNETIVTFAGEFTTTVKVEIIETDVESISVVNENDYKLIKNNSAQGYYTQEDSYNSDIWFKYTDFGDNSIQLVVTYKNGTTKTIYINSDGVYTESNQTYDNQWVVGENNTVTCMYRGISCTYNLTIVDSPLDEYPDFAISIIDYENNKVSIGGYHGTATDIVIPEEIGEYTVTELEEYSFYYDDITSIVLPKTIEAIYYSALEGCDNLTDVYFMGSEQDWNNIYTSLASLPISADIYFGIDENGNCTHLFTETTNQKDATCVEVGYTGDKVCTTCGETKYHGEEIPVTTEHVFTTYNSDNNATCGEDGTKTAICDRVGCYATDRVTDEGTALEHSFEWVVDQAPSCQAGYGHDECTRCGAKENENTPIDAEDECVVTDCKTGCCVGCGTQIYEPNAEHSFGEYQYNNDATCTEDGTQTAYCTNENCQQSDTIPYDALGHAWDNDCDIICNRGCGETRSPSHTGGTATCVDKKVCTTCGEQYGEVDGNNHKAATHYETQEANCSKTGLTAGFECTACGVDTREVIEKNDNHSYTTYTYNNNATCEEDGTETAQCDNGCGESHTRTAADTKLGHTGGTATCTEQATCGRCGGRYGTVDGNNHSYTTYQYNNDATCEEDGTETAQCDNGCGVPHNRVKEDSKLGHTGGTATCVDRAICGTCGEPYGDVDSTNHNYSSDCDTICNNNCGSEPRTNTAEHDYDDCLDAECNNCHETREAPGHAGGSANCEKGKVCETCGKEYTGVDNKYHVYSSDCDTTCNNAECGVRRDPLSEHDYDDCLDSTCDDCGATRVAPGHTGGTANCEDQAICTNCCKPYGPLDSSNHKSAINYNAVAATCTKTGLTAGFNCTACGVDTRKTVALKSHTYSHDCDNICNVCNKTTRKTSHSYGANYVSKAATEKAAGTISKKCTKKGCGHVAYVSTIAKITSIKLSKTTYTYTGKALKPGVKVNGVTLKEGTDYTAVYSKNKNAGKASVKITFKGKYSGNKTLTFKINPKATKISSLKAGKKAFTVKYSKQTSGSGYEIQYSTSKNFKSAKTVKITKNKTVSKTIKKLKAKKTYYVRVRTVKGSYKSAWSASKKVKTK